MSTLTLIIIDLSLVAVIGGLLIHWLVWEKKWNERMMKYYKR